ncbi:MAG: hypothetical protein V1822_03260 [Candidatus Micrarchaeota archaeon]
MFSIFNIKTQKVSSDIRLTHHVTPDQILSNKFFANACGPKEIKEFSKNRPAIFNNIIIKMDLFMGISVCPKGQLGDCIDHGILRVEGARMAFEMGRADEIFTLDELKAPNPLLMPNPLICSNGAKVIRVPENLPVEKVKQSLTFYKTAPRNDGWFEEIAGLPGSEESELTNPKSLYLLFMGEVGSILLAPTYGGRTVMFGTRLDSEGGVLLKSGQNK